MRYDYRNDYKNMTLENLKISLDKLTDRMLKSYRSDVMSDCVKRISYIKSKIGKMEIKK